MERRMEKLDCRPDHYGKLSFWWLVGSVHLLFRLQETYLAFYGMNTSKTYFYSFTINYEMESDFSIILTQYF